MHDCADRRRDPQDTHIRPTQWFVVEREQERRARARDHEEDVRIIDAAQHIVDALGKMAMPEMQRRAVAEQQHDRHTIDADADLHPSRRRKAYQDDRRRDRERERDEVQPSTQFRFRTQYPTAFTLFLDLRGALFDCVESLRRDRLAWFARRLRVRLRLRAHNVVRRAVVPRARALCVLLPIRIAGHSS